MRRIINQPCVVIGSADRAALVRDDLNRRGLRFVSPVQSIGRLRRHLVLGEDASMILCVLLSVDDLTPKDRLHIARLLDDRKGFATRVFCVGVVCESESFARWASLGCDAYVASARAAFDVIRAHTESCADVQESITAQQLLRPAVIERADRLAVQSGLAKTNPQNLRTFRARSVTSTSDAQRGKQPPT